MPGCIVSAITASFRSVEKRRRRATPVITSTFENVSDIGLCLGLCLGPPPLTRTPWMGRREMLLAVVTTRCPHGHARRPYHGRTDQLPRVPLLRRQPDR